MDTIDNTGDNELAAAAALFCLTSICGPNGEWRPVAYEISKAGSTTAPEQIDHARLARMLAELKKPVKLTARMASRSLSLTYEPITDVRVVGALKERADSPTLAPSEVKSVMLEAPYGSMELSLHAWKALRADYFFECSFSGAIQPASDAAHEARLHVTVHRVSFPRPAFFME